MDIPEDGREEYRKRFKRLYQMMGLEPKRCRCGAVMYFVETKNEKRNPMTLDGVSHFSDCPDRAKYRKPVTPLGERKAGEK